MSTINSSKFDAHGLSKGEAVIFYDEIETASDQQRMKMLGAELQE